ncbi:benenodin family lasso peptide [Novosphingobium sp. LASN5T]|nr:benenodin family lasso peptide [Novosphingobium sp. LASN5T]RQW39444.1 benenodin family lasso peptide [Novosphingobium sp. LASN5T]
MDHAHKTDAELIDLGDARIETKGPPAGEKFDILGPSRVGETGLNDE